MAKVLPTPAPTVNTDALTPATAPAVNTPERTPDNTPIPGGGRWRWDALVGVWADNTDPASSATTPFATPQPE